MRELEGRSDRGREAPRGRGSEVPALRGRGEGELGGLQAALGDARQPGRSGAWGCQPSAGAGDKLVASSCPLVPVQEPPQPLSLPRRRPGAWEGLEDARAPRERASAPVGRGGKRSALQPHLWTRRLQHPLPRPPTPPTQCLAFPTPSAPGPRGPSWAGTCVRG